MLDVLIEWLQLPFQDDENSQTAKRAAKKSKQKKNSKNKNNSNNINSSVSLSLRLLNNMMVTRYCY